MELVRIPTQELDKAWGLVDKDIRQALAYSSQLTDSDFVFETAKENNKDRRAKMLASQQSELIDQKQNKKPPKNFENTSDNLIEDVPVPKTTKRFESSRNDELGAGAGLGIGGLDPST